ncbi:MAG TPA: tetratricopeptide repeat protein [Blastocatellia bacterium]|jgi:tetratricopeptide (TPR) repeat protein|nr:tetratricopeptide repeat protein [Blastocatellia bacterium]
MIHRLPASLLALALLCGLAFGQDRGEPEVVSALGGRFYAQNDEKNQVGEAEKKLAADPRNVDLLIALGRAQAAVWRFRDAIETYTRAIEMYPGNAMLYRHRGHRYISTRQFDRAVKDLERAAKLNDKDFDIWYHLGLAYYLKGQFARASSAYEKCRAVAAGDDSLVAVSDWLYMTYRRRGKSSEAREVLERITPEMKVVENKSYFDRLLFYKGLKNESEIVNDKMTDLEIATVGYGIGNWHLYGGDRAKAKEYFERVLASKYWPAFGFIASEAELARK